MKFLYLLTFLPLATLLTACATTPPGTVSSLVINNRTNALAENVTLDVLETNEIFSCNMIMSGAFCALDFPPRENRNNTATLSWSQNNRYYKQTLKSQDSNDEINGTRQRVIVDVLDRGELAVRLEKTINLQD